MHMDVQQVGEKGKSPAERFATDEGVQSIDKSCAHAGSSGQQQAVENSSPHWQCLGYHTGQQPAVEGQQPRLH
jgi:hypothetical protein